MVKEQAFRAEARLVLDTVYSKIRSTCYLTGNWRGLSSIEESDDVLVAYVVSVLIDGTILSILEWGCAG